MFEYVIMKYYVNEIDSLESDYVIRKINVSKKILYPLFTTCFETSDGKFYHRLSASEKEKYFNEQLGFPKVFSHPASHLVYFDGQLIGFALCVDYLKNNIHISCMCVLPEFQSKGIGTQMLKHIESWCIQKGVTSITLGTEKNMNAFQLYKSFGFYITETHHID